VKCGSKEWAEWVGVSVSRCGVSGRGEVDVWVAHGRVGCGRHLHGSAYTSANMCIAPGRDTLAPPAKIKNRHKHRHRHKGSPPAPLSLLHRPSPTHPTHLIRRTFTRHSRPSHHPPAPPTQTPRMKRTCTHRHEHRTKLADEIND
jgi:hypothetical protein